ncbi:hypothetical protein [Photobacterium arenosum]|uniref:hypothetical protein n=1 Tax=Photobacterium arenosum TaxID=2774143 RepID=UPI00288B8C4D|nr:hypothetical protein [Photobacterium arenosum]
MELILTAINIVLTLLLGLYVAYLNRRPEIAKISHNEVMSLLKEKHLEALEWWAEIDKYIVNRQEREFRVYLSMINKKIKEDQRDIDPKIKALEAVDNFNDEDDMKAKDIPEEDIKTMVFISKITTNAILNIDSLKCYLPQNFVEPLNERENELLILNQAGLTVKNRDLLDSSIKFLYKYFKILEIAYYSGMNSKLTIDRNDLVFSKKL